MTIPFHRDGISLPVCQALLALLSQEAERTDLDLGRCTQLTFNFRNPGYSAEQGGVHPVEIRLVRGLDDWLFDYVTDFSYQGLGQDAELCKELDFNFLDGEHTMLGWGPLRLAEARELFDIWQSNFIAYYRLECFSITVSGD
ncbi:MULTISPECIES: DUF2787 domain-containing protein [Aeromonas]|uniref:DUF2787 domain-containing protein n=1 Tax=Aeromonas caviae TaxID=648 RepID=A0AA42VD43_AERCA|nr:MULTISPECIES: DUF2787 domain-containing protein [Aeromonas]MDH1898978.1 DUF2787 domain-containing protein [Aeromonas caviae]MDO2950112.1 DUF2787 domain-containing protein [Aeromonas simiae]MDO2953592.1 DUF2787 domain-containing protein [Aeromonas simiae]MDO2957520.1 DUF2787 domain-containing protein [Aeromonas simiae]MEA9416333.1 DUF2787 domain-containing protein [Aeromonas caviae]